MVLFLPKNAHRRQRLAVIGITHYHDSTPVRLHLEHIPHALFDGFGTRDHKLHIPPIPRYQIPKALGQCALQRMHPPLRNPGHLVQLGLHLFPYHRITMADDEYPITACAIDKALARMVGNIDAIGVLFDAGFTQTIELGRRGTPMLLAIIQQLFMR